MPIFADGRVPVEVVADAAALAASLASRPGAAILAEAPPPDLPPGAAALASFDLYGSSHPVACACCIGGVRSPVAQALDRLFLARVTRQARWFDRVVALLPDAPARDALLTALREDPVTPSRYRLETSPPPPAPPVEKFPPDE